MAAYKQHRGSNARAKKAAVAAKLHNMKNQRAAWQRKHGVSW